MLGNVLDRELNLSVFFDGIHINPRSRHGIFADIYVQVLKHAPDAAAVRTDQKRFRLENTDQVEIAAFEPLRKFSVHLLYQFIQVQVHEFQFNISGADLRCLDKVLRQLFQAL